MLFRSGPISISDVTTELGLGARYSASLSFLNGYMKSPPSTPNLAAMEGLTYYQQNNVGNCAVTNCPNSNCPSTNCTNCNCNCGNRQCTQCLPSGSLNSECSNCSNVDCLNCDSQAYLQTNCNCASGLYNCNCVGAGEVGYNCGAAATATYNCNCACNCSKIVCAKLHDFGLLGGSIWQADQEYGR